MSRTIKKQKHTLHRSKREYSARRKTQAIGRIKQGHGAFICPCCVHAANCVSAIKVLSRRIIRRTYIIIIDDDET